MHLSIEKFRPNKFSTYEGYCGDFPYGKPLWSKLRPIASDSEIGIFIYIEMESQIHQIRFVLNDTIMERDCIHSWILYPIHSDKKDFPKLPIKKLVIFNDYNVKRKDLEYVD